MPGTQTPQQKLVANMNKLFNVIGDTNYHAKKNIVKLLTENLQEIDLNTQFTSGPQQGNTLFFVICNDFYKLLPLVIHQNIALDTLAAIDFRTKAARGAYQGFNAFHLLTLSAVTGCKEAKEALTSILNMLPFDKVGYSNVLGFDDKIDIGMHKGCTPFWFMAVGARNGLDEWLDITLKKYNCLPLYQLTTATKENANISLYYLLEGTPWKSKLDFMIAFQMMTFFYHQFRQSNFQSDPSNLVKQLKKADELAHIAQNEGHLDVYCYLTAFFQEIGDIDNMKCFVNKISPQSPYYQNFHFYMANELRTQGQQFSAHYDPTPKSPTTSAALRDDMLVEQVCHGLKSGKEATNDVRDAIYRYADPDETRQPAVRVDGVVRGNPYDPVFDHIKGKTLNGDISGSPTTVRYLLNSFRNSVNQSKEIAKLKQKVQRLTQHCHEHGFEPPKSPGSPKPV